jgi:hypothetical protein
VLSEANLNATYKPYQGITIPNQAGNDEAPNKTLILQAELQIPAN